MATGSEVALILDAQAKLKESGIAARVVSMPSWELFEKQDAAYKEKVFPKAIRKRLAVETGSPLGWHKYVTDEGDIIAMHTFGESAPAEELYKVFGFTIDNVVAKAKALLGK
ncbi:transketolase-like TK C-terminal-containing protein [Pedobacter sp. NJ-S-72]